LFYINVLPSTICQPTVLHTQCNQQTSVHDIAFSPYFTDAQHSLRGCILHTCTNFVTHMKSQNLHNETCASGTL